jgi:hypothetical protein
MFVAENLIVSGLFLAVSASKTNGKSVVRQLAAINTPFRNN